MGLLLVLRSPQPRRKSLRRATRAQRREAARAEAEEWAAADARGGILDVAVADLLALRDLAGVSRLPAFAEIAPWSDAVLYHADLPQLEVDVERLSTAVGPDGALPEVVAAVRALLARWRAEPDLVLYCYGD